MLKKPPYRKLRGYAFDPSLSLKMDTSLINEIIYKIPWEDNQERANGKYISGSAENPKTGRGEGNRGKTGLSPGPCGEYLDVIDYDPTVNKFYAPVDLSDEYILAQDGLSPSASNPQFHQQMVYAVAMTTIKNFESALGRPVLWSARKTEYVPDLQRTANTPIEVDEDGQVKKKIREEYVRTLRIYPHAFRDANAYYSPQKKALLFGYFSAKPADVTLQMPDNLTFTCLSHDIIAHETTHAILDGLHRKYTEATNPDVLAFHEAFADIIALFQHFTFPEVLKNQIAVTRGDLASQNLLGKLAQEFGVAIGGYGSLRDAIGKFDSDTNEWHPIRPTGDEYRTLMEPHERGSILVAAVFEAFLSIYKSRVADLLRIATNGTGILPQGELQPDLVNRLAAEASKAAQHVLNMCIRAIDYCPPVDINFGDFLRAVITADTDLVTDDNRDYRLAFIDAFRKRGIYPTGIKHLSVESLSYAKPATKDIEDVMTILVKFLKEYREAINYQTDREQIFRITQLYIGGKYDQKPALVGLHRRLINKFTQSISFEKLSGIMFGRNWKELGINTSTAYLQENPAVNVSGLYVASRVGPNGNKSNQIIVQLVQTAFLKMEKNSKGEPLIQPATEKTGFGMSGGCTLIFDLDSVILKYSISKPLIDIGRLDDNVHQIDRRRCIAIHKFQNPLPGEGTQFQAYFGMQGLNNLNEPFNFLHTH